MPTLSPLVAQIANMAAEGYTDGEIAEKLGMSVGSVKVIMSTAVYPAFGLGRSYGNKTWGNQRVRLALAIKAETDAKRE